MPWNTAPKTASSFSNSPRSGFEAVGSLGLDNPIFAGLDFNDVVPGTGKTLGQLTFDTLINAVAFTNYQKS